MKKNIKFISLLITAILLVGAVIGISVSAEETDTTPGVRIAGQNLAYESAVQILYLVETKNAEGYTPKLLISDKAFEVNGAIPADVTVKECPTDKDGNPLTVTAKGKTYYAIFSDGIYPKDMRVALYATPVLVSDDGAVVAGKQTVYSPWQYSVNRFDAEPSAAQLALYSSMLDYAAALQEGLMTPEEIAARGGYADAYCAVQVNTALNGLTKTQGEKNYYRPGEQIKINPDRYLEKNQMFLCLTNKIGHIATADNVSPSWTDIALTAELKTYGSEILTCNYTETYASFKDFESDTPLSENGVIAADYCTYDVAREKIATDYFYKGVAYVNLALTTDTKDVDGDGNKTEKYVTKNGVYVFVADLLTKAQYDALTPEEQAETGYVIETKISGSAYLSQTSNGDENDYFYSAKKIVALETTAAYNKGDIVGANSFGTNGSYYVKNDPTRYKESDMHVVDFDFNFSDLKTNNYSTQMWFTTPNTLTYTNGSSTKHNKLWGIAFVANKNGTFYICVDGDTGNSDDVKAVVASNLSQDQWYNLRLEYDRTYEGKNGFEIRVYLDGQLLNKWYNGYAQNKGLENSTQDNDFNGLYINYFKAATDASFKMDNVFVASYGNNGTHNAPAEYEDDAAFIDYDSLDFSNSSNTKGSTASYIEDETGATKRNYYTKYATEFDPNKVLKVVKQDGVKDDLTGYHSNSLGTTYVYNQGKRIGDTLIFETDFNYLYASEMLNNTKDWVAKLMLVGSKSNSTTETGEILNLTIKNNVSDTTKYSLGSVNDLTMGWWYRIRIEATPTHTTVLKNGKNLYIVYYNLYIDGVKVITNGSFAAQETDYSKLFNGFALNFRTSANALQEDATLLFDNTYMTTIHNDYYGQGQNYEASNHFTGIEALKVGASGDDAVKYSSKLNTNVGAVNYATLSDVTVGGEVNRVLEFGKNLGAEWGYTRLNVQSDSATDTTKEKHIIETDFKYDPFEQGTIGTNNDNNNYLYVWKLNGYTQSNGNEIQLFFYNTPEGLTLGLGGGGWKDCYSASEGVRVLATGTWYNIRVEIIETPDVAAGAFTVNVYVNNTLYTTYNGVNKDGADGTLNYVQSEIRGSATASSRVDTFRCYWDNLYIATLDQ